MDCIVPFYNEGERVVSVVDALTRVPSITRIICVDDGSADHVSEKLKKTFPSVILICLNKNSGKSSAVFAGLRRVTSDTVLLFDGDLMHVIPEEIERAIHKFFTTPALDMLILKAHGKTWHVVMDHIFRNYLIQSGLRMMKTEDLRKIATLHMHGYQIEVAINQYMMDRKKNAAWCPISAVNLLKTEKSSFRRAWEKDFAMDRQIMSYLGPVKRLNQILFFCRRRLV